MKQSIAVCIVALCTVQFGAAGVVKSAVEIQRRLGDLM